MKKKLGIGILSVLVVGGCTSLPTSTEYLSRGNGYLTDGNLAKAIVSYNKAIQLNPANLDAYASRGAAHFFQGHYDLAKQDFEKVLQENPLHVTTYSAYGSVLAAQGEYQQALQIFDLAIKHQPTKAENYFSRAGVYFMLGQYGQAVADYTTVLKLSPAKEVLNARGAAYMHMGQEKLAQQDFELAKTANMPATLHVYSMIK